MAPGAGPDRFYGVFLRVTPNVYSQMKLILCFLIGAATALILLYIFHV